MVTRINTKPLPKKEQFEGNIIGEQDVGKDERIEYICSSCHVGPLVVIRDKHSNSSNLFCKHCGITYDLEDKTVRHRHRLEVPEDTEPAISIVNVDFSKDVEIRHTPPIRGGFAELQKKGLKLTDYHTTEKE